MRGWFGWGKGQRTEPVLLGYLDVRNPETVGSINLLNRNCYFLLAAAGFFGALGLEYLVSMVAPMDVRNAFAGSA